MCKFLLKLNYPVKISKKFCIPIVNTILLLISALSSYIFEWEKREDWGAVRCWRKTKITVLILTNFNDAMANYWASELFSSEDKFLKNVIIIIISIIFRIIFIIIVIVITMIVVIIIIIVSDVIFIIIIIIVIVIIIVSIIFRVIIIVNITVVIIIFSIMVGIIVIIIIIILATGVSRLRLASSHHSLPSLSTFTIPTSLKKSQDPWQV